MLLRHSFRHLRYVGIPWLESIIARSAWNSATPFPGVPVDENRKGSNIGLLGGQKHTFSGTSTLLSDAIVPTYEWVAERSGDEIPKKVALILHGILGNRTNWRTFSKKLLSALKGTHDILLVDLRNHGQSEVPKSKPVDSNSVAGAARDLRLLERELDVKFDIICGHSFGGKVALSFLEQEKESPPTQVWTLDTYPDEADSAELYKGDHDSVYDILKMTQAMKPPFTSRREVVNTITSKGYSSMIANWLTTSLKYIDPDNASKGLTWSFDASNIESMYNSYMRTNFWDLLDHPPASTEIHVVRAGLSHRWTPTILQRLEESQKSSGGRTRVHLLEDAGHWVHIDRPVELLDMLKKNIQHP